MKNKKLNKKEIYVKNRMDKIARYSFLLIIVPIDIIFLYNIIAGEISLFWSIIILIILTYCSFLVVWYIRKGSSFEMNFINTKEKGIKKLIIIKELKLKQK